MKEIKLPEKLYFTVDEIATQWGCDESTVRHYIAEGMLRPSVESSELSDEWALFDDFTGADTWPGDERDLWRKGFEGMCWHRSSKSQKIYRKHHLPRFMYINGRHVIPDTGDEICVATLENLEGEEFGISKFGGLPSDDGRPAVYDIRYFYVTDRYNSPWITKDERDRFERAHGMAENAPTKSESYSTPYIEVMHDAVAEFFEPRHSVDPKKAEVVDWVNGRLAESGLASENIAQAIFTIIKPLDHDPRKRRG